MITIRIYGIVSLSLFILHQIPINVLESVYLTLYEPIFCSHVFNFGAVLLCVGDFSQKIV